MIRTGKDPSMIPLPVQKAAEFILRIKYHKDFADKSKKIVDTAKPTQFTEKSKWEYWNMVFIKFLKSIPGRNGVPLKYICMDKDEQSVIPGVDFLKDDIDCAPLEGNAFMIDVSEVSTYLTSFIFCNTDAEEFLLKQVNKHNVNLYFMELNGHY